MKAILGYKVGMTQLWNDAGRLIGGTIISAKPNFTETNEDKPILIQETNGKISKAQKKIADDHKIDTNIWMKEFSDLEVNESKTITVEDFKEGDKVKVSGVTKGKGWAGVMKRHNFHGGPASHGGDAQRAPGSIGNQQPQRVVKGTKMAGRMGGENFTVKGGKILAVYPEKNILIVSGAVPGPIKSRVIVKTDA